jgi:hypothetical protein
VWTCTLWLCELGLDSRPSSRTRILPATLAAQPAGFTRRIVTLRHTESFPSRLSWEHNQLLNSALHGTAMRYAAERHDLAESIAELREIADGHDEVLAEAAGITAGSWYAWPSTHVGHELVATLPERSCSMAGNPQ